MDAAPVALYGGIPLFVEAEHPALAALVVVLDVHTDHGPDPSESVDHDPNKARSLWPTMEPRSKLSSK